MVRAEICTTFCTTPDEKSAMYNTCTTAKTDKNDTKQNKLKIAETLTNKGFSAIFISS
jgi:SOS response regulatory protein OraA/RecX